MGSQWQVHAQEIAMALSGPIIASKGPVDVITDGAERWTCRTEATPKRSGGQGDVLAGEVLEAAEDTITMLAKLKSQILVAAFYLNTWVFICTITFQASARYT